MNKTCIKHETVLELCKTHHKGSLFAEGGCVIVSHYTIFPKDHDDHDALDHEDHQDNRSITPAGKDQTPRRSSGQQSTTGFSNVRTTADSEGSARMLQLLAGISVSRPTCMKLLPKKCEAHFAGLGGDT